MEELEQCCFGSLSQLLPAFLSPLLTTSTHRETAAAWVIEQEVTQQGKQNNQSEGLEKFSSEALSPRQGCERPRRELESSHGCGAG